MRNLQSLRRFLLRSVIFDNGLVSATFNVRKN